MITSVFLNMFWLLSLQLFCHLILDLSLFYCLILCPLFSLLSMLWLLNFLLVYCLFCFYFMFRTSTALLSFSVSTPIFGFLIVLLFLLILNETFFYLAYLALKTFKPALLDKFLHHRLTSLVELICFSLLLGLFSNCNGTIT